MAQQPGEALHDGGGGGGGDGTVGGGGELKGGEAHALGVEAEEEAAGAVQAAAVAADSEAAPSRGGRFNANDAQLARLIELFDTGMAAPRGDELQRLTTEIAVLGPITEQQLCRWWQNRKSGLAQGMQVRRAAPGSGGGALAGAAGLAGQSAS